MQRLSRKHRLPGPRRHTALRRGVSMAANREVSMAANLGVSMAANLGVSMAANVVARTVRRRRRFGHRCDGRVPAG